MGQPRQYDIDGTVRAPRHATTLLILLMLAVAPARAAADRVGRLIQILETDPSYKVRLRVVITLAKIDDRRVPPALTDALFDRNHLVRGIAAKALGQREATEALAKLRGVARRDKHPFVRKQAKRAAAALARIARHSRRPRIYLTVGSLRNTSSRGGPQAARALRNALLAEFERVPGVTTRWRDGKPTGADLARRKVKGFMLTGAIQLLSPRRVGPGIEIRCRVRVALSTYPGNSMKAFYSGEAAMELSARRRSRAQMDSLHAELLAGAAKEARKHIVGSFLGRQ